MDCKGGLDEFKHLDKVNTTPLLKDLYQHITPQYAADWKVIGTLLGLPSGELKAIEAGWPTNVKWCCNQMLEKWLEIDTTASWRKLFTVIESPAVSYSAPDKATALTSKLDQLTITDNGAEAVTILSNFMIQINVQTRFMTDDDTWPPEQPTSFTPLLLNQHQGHHTLEQVTASAKLMHAGDIQKTLDISKATKEIEKILSPLEKEEKASFVLIEGAPGIGKTILLKEIAYRWGNKQLLQKFELVLLIYFRDPSLQQIKSVSNLLQLFCKGDDNATKVVSACSEYLSRSGGKNLILLLDGYDEYPEHLQKDSLIADIMKRKVLPHCGLVVSSLPHASGHFHKQATIRVDILGFTETEREHYIKQALPDQPHKVKELTQYLHQQPSVDSICFIPFNMVVLLYLYKLGIALPKNSTELYHHFICFTICRHLSKFGSPLVQNITNLTNLPEPYNRIIQRLSKLSLEALNNNKLIFTLHELTAACPDIGVIPGAINGFGLLQTVQHFGLHAKMITLNFIHLTIQEFLAAHYIAHLPPNEELKVIGENFWSDNYFNMFSIYISLTKGQRSSFKTFLCGGNKSITIADKFLKDQLKCLRLYKCFNEADDYIMCKTIERAEIFKEKQISLGLTTLTASDMECISPFLTSSFNKEWKKLDLIGCHIQDKGLNILYRGLRHSTDVTIDVLGLDYNSLTSQSSPLISELTVKCKVKMLAINGNNTIGEDQQLYSMLTNHSTELEQLYMYSTSLSSRGARALFATIMENNKLKELNLAINDITDDACDVITTALQRNSCLVTLSMQHNRLSSEAIKNIVRCLEANNTLQLLELAKCPQAIYLQKFVNKKRESRGCQVKLKIEIVS